MTARSVGEVLRDLLSDQLAAERATRASLIQRSTVVMTSAGVLVSICFAASALITRVQTYKVPGSALALIGTAVALFVVAALLALYINAPRVLASIDLVRGTVREDLMDWARPDEQFEVSAYKSFVQLLDNLTAGNRSIARWLTGAFAVECAALVCLTLAVIDILSSR